MERIFGRKSYPSPARSDTRFPRAAAGKNTKRRRRR